ncbi:Uncharacterised protein [Mycobacteroides abscessus subsp. abscessus]|nr:Uncharacterised protein [Mycobacteroides abscessus subsp. abscessus]
MAESRATTWVAISELPPRAKKSSSAPIGSALPSASANSEATSSATRPRGARNSPVRSTGAGRAFRSSLPAGVSGRVSSTVTEVGTMCRGRASAAAANRSSGSTCAPGTGCT